MDKTSAKHHVVIGARVRSSITNPPYTCVVLEVGHPFYAGQIFTASGFSKMRPGDTWSATLGYNKAYGRAFGSLVRQVMGCSRPLAEYINVDFTLPGDTFEAHFVSLTPSISFTPTPEDTHEDDLDGEGQGCL